MKKIIPVVIGVVQDRQAKLLVALRPQDVPQGGMWEFPGGKVEPGETVWQALVREMHEEVGIIVQTGQAWLQLQHTYPERIIDLYVWKVEKFTGEAHGREGQTIRWVTAAELAELNYPSANRPIIKLLLKQAV